MERNGSKFTIRKYQINMIEITKLFPFYTFRKLPLIDIFFNLQEEAFWDLW